MNKKIIILTLLLLSGCNNNQNTSSSTKDSTSNNYSSISSLSSSQHVSTVSTSTTSNVSTSTNSTTSSIVETFTVTWKNYDGTILEKDEKVPYGTMPEYNGETPKKESSDQYNYTFSGWSPVITEVKCDIEYIAQYSEDINSYTIQWLNYDGTLLEIDYDVNYGVVPSYNGETPKKKSDSQFNYVFSGWSPNISVVTKDAVYIAQFESEVNCYTITWKNYDGSILEIDEKVPYGTMPEYNGNTPEKPATLQNEYSFSGWNPTLNLVTKDATYIATFTTAVKLYTVTWVNYDGKILEVDNSVQYGEMPEYNGETPIKPATDEYSYSFNGWSPNLTFVTKDIVYTATFSSSVNGYTVTWTNYDGSILEKDFNVKYGTTPEYNGETPIKPSTAEHSYTFSGWSPSISSVTKDMTYIAQFTETVNCYTVTWKNYDGTILEVDEKVQYGEMPEYNGETPIKPSSNEYTYVFSGWSPALSKVTKDVIYTAKFENDTNTYTVTWKNYDGTILEVDERVPFGMMPEYNGVIPTKPSTAEYSYVFSGWSPKVETVTDNVVYTAQYENEVNCYTITWKNYDGNVLEVDEKVPYGATPEYNGDVPTKPSTAEYTYIFSGWSPKVISVSQDAIYVAQYESELNSYTVTWKNYDDTVLEVDEKVPYGAIPEYNGATPTKSSTAEYTYTFSGWSPIISKVTGNITYVAQFDNAINSYTVTWKNYDDTVLEVDEKVLYGAIPEYNGMTPTKPSTAEYTYTFNGWSPVISKVTGNITYVAQFDNTINNYTVTWKNYDGTILERDEEVPYGTMPEYNSATPLKPSTYEYKYTFDGWSPVVSKVTGNITYTAEYTASIREKTFEDFEDALNSSNPTRIITSGTYYDEKLDVTLNFSSTMKIVYGDEILVQYSYSYQKLNEMNENTTEMISTYTGVVYAKGNSIGEIVSNEIQWHISSEPTVVMLSFKFEKELFENYIIEGDSFNGNIKSGMENTFFGKKQNVSDVVFKVNISNKNISKLDMQYTSPNGAKVNVTTKYTYNSESVVIPN